MQQIVDTRTAARRNTRSFFTPRLLRWILDTDRRHRERRALEQLSDKQLDDVGITRQQLNRTIRHDPWKNVQRMIRHDF